MKKISAIILTLLFILTLSACDLTENDNGSVNSMPNISSSSGSSGEAINSSLSPDANPSSAVNTAVTKERALEIALQNAGLSHADVRDLDIELDQELGKTYWDIDFESGNMEYSYHIDASTEEILKSQKERD